MSGFSVIHLKFINFFLLVKETRERRLLMRAILTDNKVKVNDLQINVEGLIPQKAILRGVRVSYPTDAEGKRTSEVPDSIRYDLINPSTFDTLTVKVEGSRPVITQEELEAKDTQVFIELPLDEVSVKPYKVEYGTAYLSINAPAVKLTK